MCRCTPRITFILAFLFVPYLIPASPPDKNIFDSMPYAAQELVEDADDQAASLVLNFLYWSYRRSAATQDMQRMLFDDVTRALTNLENFNHLRHNPERSLNTTPQKLTSDDTPLDINTYETISRTYATCCKTVLSDDTPLPHHIRDRLMTIRSHIRGEISAILATKLIETYGVLSYVYDGLQNLYSNFAHLLFKRGFFVETRDPSIFSMLWTYMPSFLINIMYQFEDKHLELREDLCGVLLEDVRVSDELWNDIESIRSSAYKTMYNQVYHYLSATRNRENVFIDRFTQTNTTIYLPDPYDIMEASQKDMRA